MKNVKITTIILAILLIVLVAFGGVYVKTQNRMEDKVKGYSFGRELFGERIIELKVSDGNGEGETKPNPEDLKLENYEIVKKTIEKRLNNLNAEDYTISLNKDDGTIRVELPEDEKTDDFAYYLIASGKVQIKEKETNSELLNDSMIKKANYTYTTSRDGEYQVYLELLLNEEGQAKIEEIKNNYAVLSTEVEEIEKAESDKEKAEKSDKTETQENTESIDEKENTTENKETKKIAKLSVGGTEYGINKIEKNKITVLMGAKTTNNTSINNNMAKAAELTMLINSGKYPVQYKVQNNIFVNSEITQKHLICFALVISVILLIIFIVFIVKYKINGLLVSISCVGFIALLSLLIRYTNVEISIEGIGASIIILIINLALNQSILSKIKTMNLVNEATVRTYKDMFLKLVPIVIITLVFCFSGLVNLVSFGMIMFWGLILISIYNVLVTKTLLKLKENK